MRFLHTSDWHLGRALHGTNLIEDQAHLLEQIVGLVKRSDIEAVLVAGDVFDRAVPPVEAVALLNQTFNDLVLDLGLPVIVVAGNHDGPVRLSFGSRLLERQNLHMVGALSGAAVPILLEDAHGPVSVLAVPYTEPAAARDAFGSEAILDHDSAARVALTRLREALPELAAARVGSGRPAGPRSILVTHAFVTGALESESERPLSLGGAGKVDASALEGFSYVALGHLHRPQAAGKESIRYSGSLFPYAFSEGEKSVTLVDLRADGTVALEPVALEPRRRVRKVAALMEELLRGPEGVPLPPGAAPVSREDYIWVDLLDPGPIYDAIGRLREVFPNVLHLNRPLLEDGRARVPAPDHRQVTDGDLFQAFFRDTVGQELTTEEQDAFATVVDDLRQKEREE